MALPVWPDGLPYMPLRSAFKRLELNRPAARFEPEDGPDIMRPQAATVIERLQYAIPFTSAEYVIFRTFTRDTIVQATQRFTMPVPIDGWACETRTVYIEGGAISVDSLGSKWLPSFILAVLPAA